MESRRMKTLLWTGRAFIFLGLLIWLAGWDRAGNADLIFLSIGAACTLVRLRLEKKTVIPSAKTEEFG